MPVKNSPFYTYTMRMHVYVEEALKARWPAFKQLRRELQEFKPPTDADIEAKRIEVRETFARLMPQLSEKAMAYEVEEELRDLKDPTIQRNIKFIPKVMNEYVTVLLLAHALCEAMINEFLIELCLLNGVPDRFSELESEKFLVKWTTSLGILAPNFVLPRGGAIYETLERLNYQRNVFVHHKAGKRMSDASGHVFGQIEGSVVRTGKLDEHMGWIARYFSLPYDLAALVAKQVPDSRAAQYFASAPIKLVPLHSRG